MANETSYDVAILGSGPGGYVAAIRAGQLGLKTLVVEKDPYFGGTCLHVGCIPSKVFLYTAELLDRIRRAGPMGVIVEGLKLDWPALMKRKDRIIKKNSGGVAYLFKKNNVETLTGFGRIAGPGKLEVQTDEGVKIVAARNIIVATGSEPRSIPSVPMDGKTVVSNTEMLALASQPESIGVIGAGAVGVEFASMFHSFGTKVVVLEVLPRVVPVEDEEISEELYKSFTKRGIETLTETRVDGVKVASDDSGVEVLFTRADGSKDTRRVTKLLVAVGRKARVENIGLERAGAKLERGTIVVDGFMETTAKGIYAIGDVVATQQLAHVASAEGILAVERIAGRSVEPLNYLHMPGATYCTPEVASVGLSEAAARDKGYEVKVGKFPFAASPKANILGDTEGFVKVVSESKYGELLGVHIIGPHATDLIAEAVVALEHEATAESLMHAVHAHPTLSEAVAEAAHGAYELPLHA
jgi:dihydrolipoamide dehydrogenase